MFIAECHAAGVNFDLKFTDEKQALMAMKAMALSKTRPLTVDVIDMDGNTIAKVNLDKSDK